MTKEYNDLIDKILNLKLSIDNIKLIEQISAKHGYNAALIDVVRLIRKQI